MTLRTGDIRTLTADLGTFDVAIAPFRVLQHLTQVPEQLACLTAVRDHLSPNGRMVFDVFNPDFALMLQDRSAEAEDTPEQPLPDGRFVRRTVCVTRVHWLDQVSDIELIYYVRASDRVDRLVHRFAMRWYTARELEHLLARAGFAIQRMYGGLDRRHLSDDSPDIIVVATAAARALPSPSCTR